MTQDDFLTWKQHPVTKWVFRALETAAQAQKAAWVEASWERGVSNPDLLLELRTQEAAYRSLSDLTYERTCEVLGDVPVNE